LTNSTQVWYDNAGQWAFENVDFLAALNASGKSNVILAALTADSDLVNNAISAQDQGYNVWPVIDCSPYYEEGDFLVAL